MSNANRNSSPSRTRADSRPTVRLEYERNSGRQLGFLGFSIVAHTAFLAALAFSSQNLKPIQEIGGGDGLEAGAGSGSEISIVEVNDAGQPLTETATVNSTEASAAQKPEPSALLTDESSTITAAKIPAVAKSVEKSVVKPVTKTLPPKAAVANTLIDSQSDPSPETKVLTEDISEAPVLLANPPEDQPEVSPEEELVSAPQEKAEEPTQAVAAAAVIENPEPEPQSEPKPEPQVEAQPEPTLAPVAIAQNSEPTTEKQTENSPEPTNLVASNSSTSKTESSASTTASNKEASGVGSNQGETGSANESKGTGSGTIISGPIRDASELKALPGNPNPAYPERDRFNRKQGTSVVLGRVMADGRIGQVVLEKSSGSPTMDSESAKTFRNWRFQPGQQGWVRKPFQFRLVGEAKEVPAPLGKQLKRR